MKLKLLSHCSVLVLTGLMIASCSKSSNSSGGGDTPTQQSPTQPVMSSPASGKVPSNVVTVSWSWSADSGIDGDTWYVYDTSGDKTVKSDAFTSITTSSGHQEASTSWTMDTSNSQHTLKVELCDSTGCTDSPEVTVTISSNPPPVNAVPVITSPADGAKTTNPTQAFNWQLQTSAQLDPSCYAEFTQVTNGQPNIVKGTCSTYLNGQEYGGLVFPNLALGTTTMTVKICTTNNGNTTCTDSSKPVTITVQSASGIIIGYYSNWTVYNTKLRHGAPTDANNPYPPPYGLSGIKYQYYAGDKTRTMTQNTDADLEVRNLDYIDYAFVEAYPNKSVTFDASTGQWNPINNGTFNAANAGKIFLSDPWGDLFDTEGKEKIAGVPSGLCAPSQVLSTVSDQNRHVLCLGAYEVPSNSQTQGARISDAQINSSAYADNYFQFGNFDQFALLKATTNKNVKRLISIGGWGNEATFEAGALSSAQGQQNFIDSIAALLTYTFNDGSTLDGVDLDYEPGEYDTDGYKVYADRFVALVKALRNDPRMKGKIITVAIFADPQKMADFNNTTEPQDPKTGNWSQLAQNVDYISLMGYDFHGVFDYDPTLGYGVTDFQSNLYLGLSYKFSDDLSVAALTDGKTQKDTPDSTMVGYGVPRKQVILGVPSYARISPQVDPSNGNNGYKDHFTGTCFQGDMDTSCVDGQQSYYSLYNDETDITNVQKTGLVTTIQSWQSQGYTVTNLSLSDGSYGNYASWMFNLNSSAQKNFAAFDTVSVVQTKAYYVGDAGLGGMMMWELSSDTSPGDSNNTSLLCQMANILHSGGCITK